MLKKLIRFQSIYIIIISIIVSFCIFQTDTVYACKRSFDLKNSQYIIGGAIWIIGLSGVASIISGYTYKHNLEQIMFVCNGIFFSIISILAYHYYFYTDWDVGAAILPNAVAIAEGRYSDIDNYYYSKYPNNIFITFLFSSIIKLANFLRIDNYYMCLILCQCLIYAIVGFLVYKVAEMFFQKRIYVFLVWFLYITFVGLSPWVTIPYSDSVGLLFPILILYLFFKLQNCNWDNLSLVFIIVLVAFFGFKVKPQIGIITIAITIVSSVYLIFGMMQKNFTKQVKNQKTKKKKEKIEKQNFKKKVLACAAGLVVAFMLMSGITLGCQFELNKELNFSSLHFMMMGMNPDSLGVYSSEDVEFSASFSTVKQRNEANIAVIKERLKNYGIQGTLKLIRAKILTTYNDGTFAWGCEGSFYIELFANGSKIIQDITKNFYYGTGKFSNYFVNFMQSQWMAILFFSIWAGFSNRSSKLMNVIFLTIMGLTLFEILFEARARYLFTYAPIYILLACTGLETIVEKLNLLKEMWKRKWTVK